MENVSIKKWSVLGLVLMGASAVTAAIMPSNSDSKRVNNDNATLLLVSNDAGVVVFSCVVDITNNWSCTRSLGAATFTTGASGLADSFVGSPQTNQTVGNTSQTASPIGTPADQTSQVI